MARDLRWSRLRIQCNSIVLVSQGIFGLLFARYFDATRVTRDILHTVYTKNITPGEIKP